MVKTRDQISEDVKWDLTKIFQDVEEFNQEYEKVKQLVKEYQKYEGHVMDDAQTFYNSIIDDLEICRRLEKLYSYASLKSDEDVSDNKNQELVSRVSNLWDYAVSIMYFENTELLKVDYSVIEQFYKEEPRLLEHEISIKEQYRYKKHVLSDAEEKMLSSLSKAFGNDHKVYGYLTDSDMTFGTIEDENGKEVELTDTNYSIYIRSKNRKVRKDAFVQLYKHYKQFKNSISAILDGTIKQNVTVAHLRHYQSSFLSSLYSDEMDPKVYDTLINTVHENLDTIYAYYDLKKKVLNLDEMHMYDIYVDMIDCDESITKYPFEKGKELVLSALQVLGDTYIQDLKLAFDQKWIDIYPNKNKRGGAYSGGSYDTYPYVLLNYQEQLDDVSTLAHELGHSMHSFYTRKNQDYQYGNYPIFVAEVASTVNELLLAKYMLKHSTDKNEKLAILNKLLELFKGTIYRQVMFAEFEKYAYDIVEKEDVITSDKLCDQYYKLNQQYFGDQIIIDEEIKYEWEKVPHFFYNFYVYKYATGLSAACKIVTDILNNEPNALENYLKMLSNGCIENPLSTLKIAGVDMTDKKVYESAITMFRETMEEFKKISEIE